MREQDVNPTLSDNNLIKITELKIRQIFQMICQFGAVDSEKNQIDNIIKDMKSEIISPEDAVIKANQILNDKNGFLTQYR